MRKLTPNSRLSKLHSTDFPRRSALLKGAFVLFLVLFSTCAFSQEPLTLAERVQSQYSQEGPKELPSITAQMLVVAGLGLMPFAVMLFSSFLKIVIVLSLLRNAIGVQQTPPNQVITGMALILTFYVMFPTGLAMYQASQGTMNGQQPKSLVSAESAYFFIDVLDKAKEPMRSFFGKKHLSKAYGLIL